MSYDEKIDEMLTPENTGASEGACAVVRKILRLEGLQPGERVVSVDDESGFWAEVARKISQMPKPNDGSVSYKYDVYDPGEYSAGIRSFHEVITVTLESGEPSENNEGEFAEYVRQQLAEWYDASDVVLEGD